ncbi:MAG: DNA polymerase III subunit delta' [Lachnospiraceae bacterium]|nr:DNA polymerase III subunit delta' [Lachnospiraceae bacterium]
MTTFKSIIGQEQILSHLQNAIAQKKVSHAYIISGEQGAGKKTIATAFAKALQCENPVDNDACGVCKSCMQADSGNQPDIIWVTHEKFSIGINDIREQINSDIGIKPYSSSHKIYIVPDADRMTPEAQNALLKTIEEPPEYAVILLLAETTETLLATILSRCILLNIKPVKQELIEKYLVEHCNVTPESAKTSAGFCFGNIGKAVRYSQSEEFQELKQQVLKLLTEMDVLDLAEVQEQFKNLTADKLDINDSLDLIQLWFRDVLMFKAGQDANQVIFKEDLSKIRKQASVFSYEKIENVIKAVDKARYRLKANVNIDVTLELLLLTIREK